MPLAGPSGIAIEMSMQHRRSPTTMLNIIWRTVPLALAGASGVLIAFDWPSLGVVCAIGATYAIHRLDAHARSK